LCCEVSLQERVYVHSANAGISLSCPKSEEVVAFFLFEPKEEPEHFRITILVQISHDSYRKNLERLV